MTIEQLKTAYEANPFRPFTMHLADGRRIDVPHREFLARSPSGRTVIVYHADESYSVIDLLLVSELKIHNRHKRTGKKRQA